MSKRQQGVTEKPTNLTQVNQCIQYHYKKLTDLAAEKGVSYVKLYNLLSGRTKYRPRSTAKSTGSYSEISLI
jgi:hypothetical protein